MGDSISATICPPRATPSQSTASAAAFHLSAQLRGCRDSCARYKRSPGWLLSFFICSRCIQPRAMSTLVRSVTSIRRREERS